MRASSVPGEGTPRWDLVIFDCDGVLVDTEPIHCRIFAETVTEIGLPMSAAEVDRDFRGLSGVSSMAIVGERLGRPVPAEVLLRMEQTVAEGLRHRAAHHAGRGASDLSHPVAEVRRVQRQAPSEWH